MPYWNCHIIQFVPISDVTLTDIHSISMVYGDICYHTCSNWAQTVRSLALSLAPKAAAAALFFLSILMEQFFFFIAAALPLVPRVSPGPMTAPLLAWIVTLVIYDARILMWYQPTSKQVGAERRGAFIPKAMPTPLLFPPYFYLWVNAVSPPCFWSWWWKYYSIWYLL